MGSWSDSRYVEWQESTAAGKQHPSPHCTSAAAIGHLSGIAKQLVGIAGCHAPTWMVLRRCATNTAVRPAASSARLAMMPASVPESSADVASSHTSSRGCLQRGRGCRERVEQGPEVYPWRCGLAACRGCLPSRKQPRKGSAMHSTLQHACQHKHKHHQAERSSQAHLRKARAMATRCFSPPLSFRPRSPTTVCHPAGSGRADDSLGGGGQLTEVTSSSRDAAGRCESPGGIQLAAGTPILE